MSRQFRLLGLVCAFVLGAAAPGRAGTAAPPPKLGPADLDCLFDGNCLGALQQQEKSPIRQEDEVLPPAPRYALDLNAVPPQFLKILPGYELMPHRNQEETRQWVDYINGLIQQKNLVRRGSRLREWKYDGRPNEPPFACLSYGIGAVMDWWSLQCGQELPSNQSQTHGGMERGWDPRGLELEYFYRASTGDSSYAVFSKQLPIERDPVRQIGVPYSPLGYAEMALETQPYANPDPYTDKVYRYDPQKNPMEGQYIQLFANRILRARTPDRYARVLADAIMKWGAAYVQLEQTERPRLFGAHAVALVGYFCLEKDGRFLNCSDNRTDEDWGRTTFFVAHDSFGDFPADKVRDASGGSAYRAVRIGSIDEAYVFPHSLRVSARPIEGRPGAWSVKVANRCGRAVPLEAARFLPPTARVEAVGAEGLTVSGPEGGATLEIAASHYYEGDGGPRVFELKLDSKSETVGVEKPRSKPSQTFYERRPEAR